jgi:hypothetical protein
MNQIFSIKKVLLDALSAFLDYFGMIFTRTLQLWSFAFLFFLLAGLGLFLVNAVFHTMQNHFLPGLVLFFIFTVYVLVNLNMQYNRCMWRALHNQEISSYTLKDFSWAAVGMIFIQNIIILVGLACLVFPGIYLALRLSVSTNVFVAEKLSIYDSLRRSWYLTKGSSIELFGLLLLKMISKSFLLFSIPICALINASIYKHLVEIHPSLSK